ncbi:MAG: hypothetical protein Q6365_013505 [Candidatus Sigynarchaeota archaeon]
MIGFDVVLGFGDVLGFDDGAIRHLGRSRFTITTDGSCKVRTILSLAANPG